MPRYLVGITLYLHHLPTAFQPRKSIQLNAPFVFLAMAYLHTIYRILSRSYAGYSLILCVTQLTVVSALLKLFCSSFSVVRNCLSEFLDSSLWDLRVLYQFHNWSGTSNYLSPQSLLTSYSSNYRQRSLYGFRLSTLIGWVSGDSYKCVYIVHSTSF